MLHSPIKLLVSVRNTKEAKTAMRGGADIIDIKEPNHGPLGMANPSIILDIIKQLPRHTTTSVALGELNDPIDTKLSLPAKYIKIGLANAPKNWTDILKSRFIQLAPAKPIAVAYADHHRAGSPPPGEILHFAINNLAAGLLIDTFIKDGRNLFHWLNDSQLNDLIAAAKNADLLIALAGSLSGDDFKHAAALQPDIVAVRGAACLNNQRTQTIDPTCVRKLADTIESQNAAMGIAAD